MKITIQNLKDEIITVEVEQTDTIRRIKEKIQELNGIHPDSQYLFLGGELLNDDKLLFFLYKPMEGKIFGCDPFLILSSRLSFLSI